MKRYDSNDVAAMYDATAPYKFDEWCKTDEAQAEIERLLTDIDTKNGIIQLHQTIEAKHKAEIDALKESIKEHDKWEKEEAIAFAVIKEEWRTQIIEKKAEIDELKSLLSKARYSITDGDPETKEDCTDEIDAYFAKHKGE